MKKIRIITIIVIAITLLMPAMVANSKEEENFTLEELEELEEIESLAEYKRGSIDYYRQMVENMENIEVYDSSELTGEILRNRDGKIIIEECIGVVVDRRTGDGKLLNCSNPDYDYICYNSVDDVIYDGTIILTYFIYNPESNFEDDIMYRCDYILDREYED